MNHVILIGRLTKDPEVRVTQGNEPLTVARYTLAVDRRGKDKGTDFLNCVAFGARADFAEKYLHKGMKIAVEGSIQTGSYTNKNGDKVYTTDIIVNSHEFVESKGDDKAENRPAAKENDDFMNIPEGIEELPFK